MKYLIISFLLFGQICPNCFESKWKVKSFAVQCQTAPSVIEGLQKEGYQVHIKVWHLKEGDPICDILGVK